jgi:hypothetical protein
MRHRSGLLPASNVAIETYVYCEHGVNSTTEETSSNRFTLRPWSRHPNNEISDFCGNHGSPFPKGRRQ